VHRESRRRSRALPIPPDHWIDRPAVAKHGRAHRDQPRVYLWRALLTARKGAGIYISRLKGGQTDTRPGTRARSQTSGQPPRRLEQRRTDMPLILRLGFCAWRFEASPVKDGQACPRPRPTSSDSAAESPASTDPTKSWSLNGLCALLTSAALHLSRSHARPKRVFLKACPAGVAVAHY
jgi:hypothetical protein